MRWLWSKKIHQDTHPLAIPSRCPFHAHVAISWVQKAWFSPPAAPMLTAYLTNEGIWWWRLWKASPPHHDGICVLGKNREAGQSFNNSENGTCAPEGPVVTSGSWMQVLRTLRNLLLTPCGLWPCPIMDWLKTSSQGTLPSHRLIVLEKLYLGVHTLWLKSLLHFLET